MNKHRRFNKVLCQAIFINLNRIRKIADVLDMDLVINLIPKKPEKQMA
jgi:hypothetical protein